MLIYLIVLTVLVFLFYKCFWQPKKTHQWYVDNFRNQGYRVLDVPFKPFSLPIMDIYDVSPTSKDAMAFAKKRFPDYDVVVTNMMNEIYVDIIHPDLVHKFYSLENLESYEKNKLEVSNTKRGLG